MTQLHDIDLEELAAKAVRLRIVKRGDEFFYAGTDQPWAPRHDDGDSLRLGMALGMKVSPGNAWHPAAGGFRSAKDGDMMANTRLSVLRCAAYVGKGERR